MFFEYRFTLKIAVLTFAILGIFQYTYPALKIPGVQYFLLQTFLFFILFDLFYEIAGLKFDTIYNGLNSFFKVERRISSTSKLDNKQMQCFHNILLVHPIPGGDYE